MSYTEIYAFGPDGKVAVYAEVQNAFRGAMAVWTYLEKKYLPSLPPPRLTMEWEKNKDYWSRLSTGMMHEEYLKQIWNLVDSKELTSDERIVLASTFDNVLVAAKDIPRICTAFRNFEGESSLKEQADAIEKLLQKTEAIAIGLNQTSVNAQNWGWHGNDENDEPISYNIFTDDEHWWISEKLEEIDS